jgi:hypothetical protein
MAGLVAVTLQIAYLPALCAAFNRRENEIALLNSRAGRRSLSGWRQAPAVLLPPARQVIHDCPGNAGPAQAA